MDNQIDIIKQVTKRSKKIQASGLDQLEDLFVDRPDLFVIVRKIYLDGINDLNRLWVKQILGDFEKYY